MFAALCQSAAAHDKRRAIPVCSGFAFHVLMILDETGVLRVHPIRVIPAREVSGARASLAPSSSLFQSFLSARRASLPAEPVSPLISSS
jgi:hypothetical protein